MDGSLLSQLAAPTTLGTFWSLEKLGWFPRQSQPTFLPIEGIAGHLATSPSLSCSCSNICSLLFYYRRIIHQTIATIFLLSSMSPTFSRESSSSSGTRDLDDPTEASSIPPSDAFVVIPPNHSNEGVMLRVEQLFQSMVDSITGGVELTIPYRTRNTRTSHNTPQNQIEIPTHRYGTRSKTASQKNAQNGDPSQNQRDLLMFPARNIRKQKRFGGHSLTNSSVHPKIADSVPVALFRTLELVHDALRSGNLVTKRFEQEAHILSSLFKDSDTNRSIYYQNIELFASQAIVDHMVDNLAFTLGVGRGDLNIACYHPTTEF